MSPGLYLEGVTLKKVIADEPQHQKQLQSWADPHGPLLQVWCRGSRGSSEKAAELLQAPAEGDHGGWRGCGLCLEWAPRTQPLSLTGCVVCQRGSEGRIKPRGGGALVLPFPPIYRVLASISEQPESAERPGCTHCPQPQD